MPKRKAPEKPIPQEDPSRILDINMEDVMHASMMPTRSTSFWSGLSPGWRTG